MKYFFICLLALLAFTSCKKDSDDQQKQKSFFRMKVDGVLKEYDSCWILSFQQAAGAQIYYQNNILCGRSCCKQHSANKSRNLSFNR